MTKQLSMGRFNMRNKIKNIRYQVSLLTDPKRDNSKYKTTSFTLLKSTYEDFIKICNTENRIPSDVLRELVNLYIDNQ